MSLRFQKRKEDFICGHCGNEVRGSGFTNHCPKCLWSKHVDVYPGDREEQCRGLMEPITLTLVRGEYVITHRCVICGTEKTNRADASDNLDALLKS
jgi:hypothetical protein